nr:hypothetical protein [Tanacetum cinerariifolium]
MWHIMKKLFGKVDPDLCNNTNFKKRLCDIVWTDKIDPEDEIWCSLMHCHSLNVIESENFSTFAIRDIEADYKIHNVHVQVKYKSKDVASGSKSDSVDYVLKEIYSNVEQSVTHLVGDLEKLHLYKDAQTTLMEKAKTESEIAMKLSDRPQRLCRSCHKYTNHDSRNFPLKKGLQDDDMADVDHDNGEDTNMYLSD